MSYTSMFKSFVSFCLLIIPASLNAGTTGKIAGKVMDANTREVLIGVNVLVEDHTIRADALRRVGIAAARARLAKRFRDL